MAYVHLVERRARFWLVGHDRYRNLVEQPEAAPAWVQRLDLERGERLLGVYTNVPDRIGRDFAVSTTILYLQSGDQVERLRYLDMVSFDGTTDGYHGENKRRLDRILIQMTDGRTMVVPVVGRSEDGLHRDAWSVYNFLLRAARESREGRVY
ncbi:MAG TPA: hypothetical protein VFI42_05735 [Thermomicrobiaceae bacterium]|nr:hypothetical protein [Thermomicrobiaceae bacterium]